VDKPLTGKRALDCSFAGGDGEEGDGEKTEFGSSVSERCPGQSNVVAGALLTLLGLDVVVILLEELMSLIELDKDIGAGGAGAMSSPSTTMGAAEEEKDRGREFGEEEWEDRGGTSFRRATSGCLPHM